MLERAASAGSNFALLFIGFNLTFFPMHVLGLQGMTAARLHLPAGTGLGHVEPAGDGRRPRRWHSACSCSSRNVLWSRRHGRVAGDNPWGAGTLEWATASPPPATTSATCRPCAAATPLWEDPDATPPSSPA